MCHRFILLHLHQKILATKFTAFSSAYNGFLRLRIAGETTTNPKRCINNIWAPTPTGQ